jgi:GDPmannose 4,6-dehydratase
VDAIGIIRCLEAIRKHTPQCRFYNAGSSEEYGSVQYSPQDEKHPPCARSVYGAAKVAARQIVKVYRESYNLYAIQGSLFNHESERRGEEFVTRKITLGVARIASAIYHQRPFEPIELGNLDSKRDWSHAEDFVDGIWRMLNQEAYLGGKPNGVTTEEHTNLWIKNGWKPQEYVLASGETHTVRKFIEKAFAVAELPGVWWDSSAFGDPKDEVYLLANKEHPTLATKAAIPLVRINPAFYRPAEVDLLLGDSTRARTELGWSPKVSFDQLVERMVRNDLKAVGL